MTLRFLNRLSIVQKYQLVFWLIAILPILLYALFFFHDINEKLNHRIDQTLRMGNILIEDAVNDNLLALSHNAEHTARLLSNRISASSDKDVFKQLGLSKDFDIAFITDNRGRMTEPLSPFIPSNIPDLPTMIRQNLAGKTVSGFERLVDPNQDAQHRYQLIYLSSTPMFTGHENSSDRHILIVGRFLTHDNQLDILKKLNPGYLLRLYIPGLYTPAPDQFILAYSNKQLPSHLTMGHLNRFLRQASPFSETIQGVPYASGMHPLQNHAGVILGYFVLSIPKSDQQELFQHNIVWMSLMTLGMIAFVMIISTWFKLDFILPMNRLAQAFKQIHQGDLDTRIKVPENTNDEILNTYTSFNGMMDKFEENETLRSNFVTTMTHDLKTPLLAQERVIDILGEEFEQLDPEKRRKLLDALAQNNKHLLTMIQSLLEVYEYEDGQVVLQKQAVDLEKLVAECFSTLKPLAESNGIELIFTSPSPSLSIQGDFHQLKRVFLNLLMNAIQNIPKGSQIELDVESCRDDVKIQIKDNGQGIDPEILPHLFERYYAGEVTRKKIGSGLGLYICKTIIKLHHGAISVQSRQGHGTAFIIELPRTVPV